METIQIGKVEINFRGGIVDAKSIAQRVNRSQSFNLLRANFGYDKTLHVNLEMERDLPGWMQIVSGGYTDKLVVININHIQRRSSNPSEIETWIVKIIVHEFFHFLMKRSKIALPIWIDEGLAEYFSGRSLSYISEGKTTEFRRRYLKEIIRVRDDENHELRIRNITSPKDLVSNSYYHCFQMVKYLIDKFGLQRLFDFLSAIRKEPRGKWNTIFRTVFGFSELEFERQFLGR